MAKLFATICSSFRRLKRKNVVVNQIKDENQYYRDELERIDERLHNQGIYIDPAEKITERHIKKAQEHSPLSEQDKNDFIYVVEVQELLSTWLRLREEYFVLCDVSASNLRPKLQT